MAAAKRAWPTALAFAFSGHVGMYLLLVAGVCLAGAQVATALIGTVPVMVSVAGNLVEREFPWRRPALPLALIWPGLAAVSLAGAGLVRGPAGRTAVCVATLALVVPAAALVALPDPGAGRFGHLLHTGPRPYRSLGAVASARS